MDSIEDQVARINTRVEEILRASGRGQEQVILLAVSKKRSVDEIRAALKAGCRHFGESYVQEALPKIRELNQEKLVWHFIGPIQSNKIQAIASHFQWVHSVNRDKVAKKLNEYRPLDMKPLNVCIQVNVSGEASKSGISYEQLDELVNLVTKYPRLRLRGLMAIARKSEDHSSLRNTFKRLRETLERLNSTGLTLDTLSMGMTNDMQEAIMEGSTIVRIGSGIFGPRS